MLVGSAVGSEVGSAVGAIVGSLVGSAVGSLVGSLVGSAVGSEVGSAVGSADGIGVGRLEGPLSYQRRPARFGVAINQAGKQTKARLAACKTLASKNRASTRSIRSLAPDCSSSRLTQPARYEKNWHCAPKKRAAQPHGCPSSTAGVASMQGGMTAP